MDPRWLTLICLGAFCAVVGILAFVLRRLEQEIVAWRDRAIRIERDRSRLARECAWWRNEYPHRDHNHETARTTWIPRPPLQ